VHPYATTDESGHLPTASRIQLVQLEWHVPAKSLDGIGPVARHNRL